MKIYFDPRVPRADGFTLIEVLTSTALLALIMVLVMSTVEQTQKVWSRAATKVTQFQSARNAFDSMSRRMAQATLNAYYRAIDEDVTSTVADFNYARESELQFISGPTAKIMGSPPMDGMPPDLDHAYPTHSVFFQAPLGLTMERDTADPSLARYRSLSNALIGTGFFIEHGDDSNTPKPLRDAGLIKEKKRYRLMQLDAPTETLQIYDRPLDPTNDTFRYYNNPQILDAKKANYGGLIDRVSKPIDSFVRPMWMESALYRRPVSDAAGFAFDHARVLADNVIALVILPKLPQRDRISTDRLDQLAPYYMYDSWRILAKDPNAFKSPRHNQLPPIVQIAMIAIDEASGQRVAERYRDNYPTWTEDLFVQASTEDDYRDELAELEERLIKDPAQLNFRVFTTDVVIRGSKWSRDANFFIK